MDVEYGSIEYGDLFEYGGDLNLPNDLGVTIRTGGGRQNTEPSIQTEGRS